MKKKFISVFVAFILIILCFGLIACNNKNEGGGSDSIVSDKLSEENFEEAWVAAFDEENFANFKVEMTASEDVVDPNGEQRKAKSDSKAVRADGKEHIVITVTSNDTETDEIYYDSLQDICYVKNGNGWKSYVKGSYGWTNIDNFTMFRIMYFKNKWSEFEFSNADNGYVCVEDNGYASNKTIIKFKNNKIASVYSETIYDDDGYWAIKFDYVFTYGGQSVTIPSNITDGGDVKDPATCAHEWEMTEVIKEATCTEAGAKTYTCKLCKDSRTAKIPAPGHDWDDGYIENDSKIFSCKKCGILLISLSKIDNLCYNVIRR